MKRRMRLVLLLLSRLAELNHLNQWERNQPFPAPPAGTVHQTHRVLWWDDVMLYDDVMMWCYVIMWCDILTDSSITAENWHLMDIKGLYRIWTVHLQTIYQYSGYMKLISTNTDHLRSINDQFRYQLFLKPSYEKCEKTYRNALL